MIAGTFFGTFLASGMEFAGRILSAIITSRPESDTSDKGDRKTREPSTGIYIERDLIDKDFLTETINQTNSNFEKLLDDQTAELVELLEREKIRDTVHVLQANVTSLRRMLDIKTYDPSADQQLAMQLVLTALNPLQVQLDVARLRFKDAGASELWEFCHLLGTSTLIAGYAYLGIELPHLTQDLESVFKLRQKRMLDETARRLINDDDADFPWNRVQSLLTPEGASELTSLYIDTFYPPEDNSSNS